MAIKISEHFTEEELVRIAISPGHFPAAPGVRNNRLGLVEHDEAVKVVTLLHGMLLEKGYEVLQVTGKLAEKILGIVGWGPAVAVEVHFNGGPPEAHGTECLYGSNPQDKILAEHIQVKLVSALNLRDRGVKFADYSGTPDIVDEIYFTRKIPQPTVVVEPLFISNDEEAVLLFDQHTHFLIAKAIASGIGDYLRDVAVS